MDCRATAGEATPGGTHCADAAASATTGVGPAPAAALSLAGISKAFGGRPALVVVSLSLAPGRVQALLGENGAGKSTLMNVVAGLYAPDAGEVLVRGRPVPANDPAAVRRLGVGMVHQHFKLVRPFTVAENALLASGATSFRSGLARMRAEIRRIASALGFALDPDARVDRLSVAEQQRAEIVKVVIGGADILILDEPTAVLTDEEAASLLSTVRRLSEAGTTVVLVTHKLAEVPAYTDTVTVMRGGRVVAEGASRALSADDLTRLMVGSDLPPLRARVPTATARAIEIDRVGLDRPDGSRAVDGLSLQIRSGEIYGVAGVGGNGQTELAGLVTGLLQPDSGTIRLFGEDVTRAGTRHLRERGLAYVPAERMRHGLAEDLSVTDNFAIAGVRRGRYGVASIRRGAMRRDTRAAIEASGIAGARPDLRAGLLSGGNAQKLLLARELDGNARLLVAHSPTRGLDVRACAAVYDALLSARARGVAVLLVSEDLDEILTLSDRIGVINRGRIVGEFMAPANRHDVGRLMVGHA